MWIDIGFNGEEGYEKVRVHVPAVPREGDRFEFYGPEGAAANVPRVLEMDKWYVDEVRWVMHDQVAEPTVFLASAAELRIIAELQSKDQDQE